MYNLRVPKDTLHREARWDHRKWGTLDDPVHKSQLSALVGEYACTRQFQFDRQREARGDARATVSGSSAMGTAAHEAIARALSSETVRERLLAGHGDIALANIRRVLVEEFDRATRGLSVLWYKGSFEATLEDRVLQIAGLFRDIGRHVARVELIEAGFISEIGDVVTEGHVDLVYRPRENPDALGLTDWKTGADKPHQIVLDHGYESGFYSAALERGVFIPTEVVSLWRETLRGGERERVPMYPDDVDALERAATDRHAMHAALRGVHRMRRDGHALPEGAVSFARFPEVVRLTFLPDYVPYQKPGKKRVERPEEIAHWGHAGEVKYQAGDRRGPAWYTVRRTADDVARLERLLRAVVGWVRMGKFVEAIGEKCMRCPYRSVCLTSGYELRGDDAKELRRALRGLDMTTTDALSTDD